jgi:membrane protease YdiL (CAAX protease family)
MIPVILTLIVIPVGNIIFLAVLANPGGTFLWYHVGACVLFPVIYLRIIKKMGFSEIRKILGLTLPDKKKYIYISVLSGLVFDLLLAVFFILNKSAAEASLQSVQFSAFILVSGIYVIFFNGIFEEIFWRGFAFYLLEKIKNGLIKAVLISVSFFSFHLFLIISYLGFSGFSMLLLTGILIVSFVFYYLRKISDSLIPPVILHLILSVGYTILFFLSITP